MKDLFFIREMIFPFGCGSCGKALLTREDSYLGLCHDCRSLIESSLNTMNLCSICGKPLISEKETCLICREKILGGINQYNEWLYKLRTIFPYTGKFKNILGSYKFKKSIGMGNFFAHCLYIALNDLLKGRHNPNENEEIAWVPVPPKPGKIKEKGWDQIQYLAELLEKTYKQAVRQRGTKKAALYPHKPSFTLPVCRCLERLKSRSQKELNREERKKNLKGRILCVKPPPHTAVIFDDVFTTGATLNACAEALIGAGAKKVYGICLFYD